MPVTKRTRFEVLKRDNYTCRYCRSTEESLTVDHVVPVSLGGTDDPSNLVAACRDCNAGKASTGPDETSVEDVKGDAIRWAAAMKLAARRAEERRDASSEYIHRWKVDWLEYGLGMGYIPTSWADSIDGFRKAALPVEQLIHALSISMSRERVAMDEKFRYMCGIAWSMVKEMQDDAKAILAEQEPSDG